MTVAIAAPETPHWKIFMKVISNTIFKNVAAINM